MNDVTLSPVTKRLGSKWYYKFRFYDDAGLDISSATATIEIYDSSGSATLTATSMTLTTPRTSLGFFKYLITTGAAQTITAAGDYRVVIRLSLNSEIRILQGALTIIAIPE